MAFSTNVIKQIFFAAKQAMKKLCDTDFLHDKNVLHIIKKEIKNECIIGQDEKIKTYDAGTVFKYYWPSIFSSE